MKLEDMRYTKFEEGVPRCPKCGHMPHGPICYNMASDDDCNCNLGENPTHYVNTNSGNALFVKDAQFFIDQGGLKKKWGRSWIPVTAESIGEARKMASVIFAVPVSHIHNGEE